VFALYAPDQRQQPLTTVGTSKEHPPTHAQHLQYSSIHHKRTHSTSQYSPPTR